MLAEGGNADGRHDHGNERNSAGDEPDCGAPTDPAGPGRGGWRGMRAGKLGGSRWLGLDGHRLGRDTIACLLRRWDDGVSWCRLSEWGR